MFAMKSQMVKCQLPWVNPSLVIVFFQENDNYKDKKAMAKRQIQRQKDNDKNTKTKRQG